MGDPYKGYGEFGSAWRRGIGQKEGALARSPIGRLGQWIDENIVGPLTPQGVPPAAAGEDFDAWYRAAAVKYGLPPNPEQADYDYRQAFKEGVRGPVGEAWPDKYKRNRFQ